MAYYIGCDRYQVRSSLFTVMNTRQARARNVQSARNPVSRSGMSAHNQRLALTAALRGKTNVIRGSQ